MCEQIVTVTELIGLKSIPVPIHMGTTVEEVLIVICRELKISPIARHLFGLRYNSSQWMSLSTKLWGFRVSSFELRIRYKFPDLSKVLTLDKLTFNYYFFQVRNDLISYKINEVSYEKHKDSLLGLSVVDMYRVMLESGKTKEVMLNDYKKYIPKELINYHKFFLKKPIKDKLAKLEQSEKRDLYVIKQMYLQQFEEMVPNYMIESYKAKMDEGGIEKDITVMIHPFHKQLPGVQFQYTGKDEWNHLCSFEDLCCISLHPDGKAEISRKTGIPIYIRMNNNSLVSFITLLDGYYRLSVKWTFNLCKDFITPTLHLLQNMKCHGPVGQSFSFKKLEEKRKSKMGCFILRQCEHNYDNFFIDVCHQSRKKVSYKIELRGEGHFWFSGDEESYSSIPELISKFRSSSCKIPMLECIPPSEYDVSQLLLCRIEDIVAKDGKDVISSDQLIPQIINLKHLHLYPDKVLEGRWGLTQMRKYVWKTKHFKLDVAVKSLKPSLQEQYLQDFLDLIGRWATLRSSAVVRLLGVTLARDVSMVTEFYSLGPLDFYLQKHKNDLEEVDLVEAATYIASALWHMEGEGIVHGYLRCHKILVTAHTENTFSVKVADPGIHNTFSEHDWHWIPPELYDNPREVLKNTSADVWAFGTTLWQLFSYGLQPSVSSSIKAFYKRGARLPKPLKCSRELFTIINECWIMDPDQRKKPQAAMRDINQLLYQVHNARRSHAYTAARPPTVNVDSIETLNEISSMALDYNSGITSVQTTVSFVDDTQFDLSSLPSDSPLKPLLPKRFMDCENFSPHFSNICNLGLTTDSSSIGSSTSSVQSNMLNEYHIVIQGTIGKGFYGEVYKGFIEYPDTSEVQYVAVKKLITDSSTYIADFEREISIMKSLKHRNIVEMITATQHPEVRLIMEYVPHGSLKCYLNTNKSQLRIKDHLLRYALDVAEGMAYLGQKKIVHRDLAARNVLVANEFHVKISDFGLAQKMEPSNYYMLKTPRELPVGWYAPESLRDGKFSNLSDVWSYGVLLYEMFSFGGDPNILTEGSDPKLLLQVLESGARLGCPERCPCEVYNVLMRPCWTLEAKKRPSFLDITNIINKLSANL
ncbi:tyrosine-protein kinase hopscotch isoform X2 [Halyomorpha halys]|uniref:tyrosine-protein kinase hopscotch isoform X2 n=1 Tax=Halyomorpha halys TaxID=286706 RepID=UPI0006D4FFAA|nr:tyrosine-protein kinase hopscotch isoform X2 [Halyomorpha halys]